MNKQELLQKAKRNIDERRYKAEEQCDKTLATLRTNAEYRVSERSLRQAQVNYSMCDEPHKSEMKKLLDERKAEMKRVLTKLNIDEKTLRPKYFCKTCGDTGYVNNAMCSCLLNELSKLLLKESQIVNPAYTFELAEESDKHNLSVYKAAKEITLAGSKNLLLTGNTGTGKTYLITACANLAISVNKSALFFTAYNLNSMFLEAHLSDFRIRQSLLDALTDTDILIIDDLGTEIVYKNVTAEYLFAVLNERIARRKQTFISTNLTLADIRDRYDERIFSRLVDQSSTVVAQLTGADKRLVK